MKRFSAPIPAAVFALLVSHAHGGDRYSSDSVPTKEPYIPEMPVNYRCEVRATYIRKGQPEYTKREVTFASQDFATSGAVAYEIKNSQLNFLNGQGFRLSFGRNQDGSERVELTVNAYLISQRFTIATYETHVRPREEGEISGGAVASTSPAEETKDVRQVHVTTECKAL